MIYKLSFSFVLVILPLIIYFLTVYATKKKVLSFENITESKYALVLGAGLKQDGKPTDLLMDRILTSIQALETRKIGRLIFSGSINHKGFSEPLAMKQIAKTLGIKANQVIIDNNGKSTFDSCVNFLLSKYSQPVILVTQPFHLHRSLLICQLLGVDAYGLPAIGKNSSKLDQIWWHMRECYAIPYNLFKFAFFKIGNNNSENNGFEVI